MCRLLFIDNFNVQTLVFNARFATFLVAIAILAGIVAAGERYGSGREMPFVKLAGIALNVLALVALTSEANDYFNRQIAAVYQHRNMYEATTQLEIARNFSFSAIWIVYGAALMVIGFWKRSAFIRWQAMVLLAVTIGKVFLYDSRALQQGYRILSFHCAGRDADGRFLRLPSRLVQIIATQEWRRHGAGDIGMMKIAAVLLAAMIFAGPSIPYFQVSKTGAGAAWRPAICGSG